MLYIIIGVGALIGIGLSSIGLIIQSLRKKPKGKWETAVLCFSLIFSITVITAVITAPSKPNAEPAEEQEEVITDIEFSEIYTAFKENELVAKETYDGNLYRISAKINGMETGGLLNLTGGATLTMEKQVGDTIVFFWAEFERDQEENLKSIKVGDEITFIGECQGGNFLDCKLQ